MVIILNTQFRKCLKQTGVKFILLHFMRHFHLYVSRKTSRYVSTNRNSKDFKRNTNYLGLKFALTFLLSLTYN